MRYWLWVLLLVGCAPRTAPDALSVVFVAAPVSLANELSLPFAQTLATLDIRLEQGTAFRYEGADNNAFLAAIDRFYLENPGFCPLEKAFFYADNKTTLLTLAAKPNTTQIRAFIYDLAGRPKLSFAYFVGSSRSVQKTAPCRSVGTP
jgi:hypothetical protein